MRDDKIIFIIDKICKNSELQDVSNCIKVLELLTDEGIDFIVSFIELNSSELLRTFENKKSLRIIKYYLSADLYDRDTNVRLSIDIEGGEEYSGRENSGWSSLYESISLPLECFLKINNGE